MHGVDPERIHLVLGPEVRQGDWRRELRRTFSPKRRGDAEYRGDEGERREGGERGERSVREGSHRSGRVEGRREEVENGM
jgi:hypothetical protein